ncbi:monooxygenase [Streptomyces sp. NPDC001941]|uniref:NAD(P)/FAD-dependent oxidoreductase n=1 Tax=Streptomyces sp. NPDC001941 TaxID=3154659 RepID=UPI003318DEFE
MRVTGAGRPRRRGGHAVVVGAGVAGLLAARVLADAFARVTVVERDEPSAAPPGRDEHPHGLTARGATVVEELFPGLLRELDGGRGASGDFGERVAWRFASGWSPRAPVGIPLRAVGHDALRAALRSRITEFDGVRLRTGARASGLVGRADRVTGVRVRQPGDAAMDLVLDADLVVDASGHGSRLPGWLVELGLPRVRRRVVEARVEYVSRPYALSERDALPWDAAVEAVHAPYGTRGFYASRVGGNRLLVTFQGVPGDAPPRDARALAAFAEGLGAPLGALLARLTPCAPPRPGVRHPAVRTAYDRLPRWPEGILAVGDSVCAVDPLYGQGLGVAALEAELLRAMLREAPVPDPGQGLGGLPAVLPDGFCRYFQVRVARLTRWPWLLSTAQDRGWRQGAVAGRAVHVLAGAAQRALAADPYVFRRFLLVAHLVLGPRAFLRPPFLWRCVRAALRRPGAGAARLWWGRAGHAVRGPRAGGAVRVRGAGPVPGPGRLRG